MKQPPLGRVQVWAKTAFQWFYYQLGFLEEPASSLILTSKDKPWNLAGSQNDTLNKKPLNVLESIKNKQFHEKLISWSLVKMLPRHTLCTWPKSFFSHKGMRLLKAILQCLDKDVSWIKKQVFLNTFSKWKADNDQKMYIIPKKFLSQVLVTLTPAKCTVQHSGKILISPQKVYKYKSIQEILEIASKDSII